jgi:peroxiredoxin Q/BCP
MTRTTYPWLVRHSGLAALVAIAVCTQVGCMSAERAAEIETAAAERSPLAGKQAPDFALPNQDGETVTLQAQKGRWVVLYFYPADGTPGCTCQAREFTKSHAQFQRLSAKVFGVSPDSVASHRNVVDKYKLKVDLLADPDQHVMEAYGASAKTPFGRRVIRSTALIDPAGNIAYHWPEVIAQGHADRVRAKLDELQAGEPSSP